MSADNEVSTVIKALERAKEHVPKDWDYLANDEEVMLQVMELDYNPKPLSQHVGVDKEMFPVLEQLEDDEVKLIVDKIIEVMAVYHYIADLPAGLPIRIAYTVLLGIWDEVVTCCPMGNFHFDFYELELEQYVNPAYKKFSARDWDLPF